MGIDVTHYSSVYAHKHFSIENLEIQTSEVYLQRYEVYL